MPYFESDIVRCEFLSDVVIVLFLEGPDLEQDVSGERKHFSVKNNNFPEHGKSMKAWILFNSLWTKN